MTAEQHVYVVSWVDWAGDEQSSGGFDWYYTEADALVAFAEEKLLRAGDTHGSRVRLVPVLLRVAAGWTIPDRFDDGLVARAQRQRITDHIDRHLLDDIEDCSRSAALRVAIYPPRAAA